MAKKQIYSSAKSFAQLSRHTLGAFLCTVAYRKVHCHQHSMGLGCLAGSSHLLVSVCSLQIAGCSHAAKHTPSGPPHSVARCVIFIFMKTLKSG